MRGALQETLDRLIRGQHLSATEASELMVKLADESLAPALAGAVLAALRCKGETPEEIRGFATAMRGLARRPPIDGDAVDVVGTGGDGSGSLNLSTGAALLASACGLPVVKHGNRSVSSRSGSADVLEALGCELPGDEPSAARCLDETGFTFLFAPTFHPAMKALAPVRRALGVRTVFNLLGPLTNPAAPPYAVIGAFSRHAAALIAESVAGMPVERAFVIHGEPGWDEATPVGPFLLHDVRAGKVVERDVDPLAFGIARCAPEALLGGDAAENAGRLEAALGGEAGPHLDALVLGAGLALEVADRAPSLARAIEMAREAITTGAARTQLDRIRSFRNGGGDE